MKCFIIIKIWVGRTKKRANTQGGPYTPITKNSKGNLNHSFRWFTILFIILLRWMAGQKSGKFENLYSIKTINVGGNEYVKICKRKLWKTPLCELFLKCATSSAKRDLRHWVAIERIKVLTIFMFTSKTRRTSSKDELKDLSKKREGGLVERSVVQLTFFVG